MRLGQQHVSKLDTLKGHWEVPLTPRASVVSVFVTPDHFLQYSYALWNVQRACYIPKTSYNKTLRDVPNCRAYLHIVVYSGDWATLTDIFQRLSAASLTLNLAKCEFGKGTVLYLGQQVGQGQVCPLDANVAAIAAFPSPATRRQLRQFLGMAGLYCRFCKSFFRDSPVDCVDESLNTFHLVWLVPAGL